VRISSIIESVVNLLWQWRDSFEKMPNVRDQRRHAVGAPPADRNLWNPLAVPASGVTTRDDRCIALLGHPQFGMEACSPRQCQQHVQTEVLPSALV
jgi:hypothetical protein